MLKRFVRIIWICKLIGDPALHRVIIVTPAVYPHLNDFYRETLIFRYKSQTPTRVRQGVPELWLDRQKKTNEQTEITNFYIKQTKYI